MSKVGAYGTAATTFRRTWNEEEYAAKAKAKDEEHAEAAKEAQEAIAAGRKPAPRRRKEDLPKPTEHMKQREGPLDLGKDLNKVLIVSGDKRPGFWCDICRRNNKDSVAYLDHINGRSHLRRLGQTTRVVKSSLNDVRLKIAELRQKTAEKEKGKKYDFEERLREIRRGEAELKRARKEEKLKARRAKENEGDAVVAEGSEDMLALMGFGGFGGGGPKK